MEEKSLLQKHVGKEDISIASDILSVVNLHRQKAYQKINEEQIAMYYEIGKYLSEKIATNGWGSKTIATIAKRIKEVEPTLKGFSKQGLYRMIMFYDTYRDNIIVSALLRQISLENKKPLNHDELYNGNPNG